MAEQQSFWQESTDHSGRTHISLREAHSKSAFKSSSGKATRCKAVLECIRLHGAMTARQVKAKMQAEDMNEVRPRISELKKAKLIIECGKVPCEVTGHDVAVFSDPYTQIIKKEMPK